MAKLKIKTIGLDVGRLPDQTATLIFTGGRYVGRTLLAKEIAAIIRMKKLDRDYRIAKSNEDLDQMAKIQNEQFELMGLYPPK